MKKLILLACATYFFMVFSSLALAAPDCTATGDLSDVCAGTTGLLTTVPTGPVGTTYLWSISANGAITGPTDQPSVTFSAVSAGTLTLTVQVTDPVLDQCIEDYSFTVYANPVANILANGVSTSLAHACFGVNLSLNGSPSGGSGSWSQHLWTGSGAVYLSSTTIQNPVFNSTLPGSYSLVYQVTDSRTCVGQDTITIQVHNNPTSNILVEGTPTASTSVCSEIDLSLDGNPSGGSGSFSGHAWTGTGAVHLSATNIRNPVFNAPTSGTFTLTYTATDTYGCTAFDNLSVTVVASPIPDIRSNGVSMQSEWLCLSELTTLNGNPAGGSGVFTSHTWTGDTAPLSAVNIQSPTFVTGIPGLYNLTYTVIDANGCYGIDTISIQVANPMVDIRANGVSTATFETCAGVSVSLNGNPTGGSGSYSHLWAGNTGPLSNLFIHNPNFTTSTPGLYNLTYTVTDNQGCSANDSISITVHPNPVADILIAGFPLATDWLCINESVALDGNPSGGSNIYVGHLWTGSGASRLNNPNIQNPVFQSSTAGNYSLTYRVTDSRGCIRTDSITIRVAIPIPDVEADGFPAATFTACAGRGVILNGNPKNGSQVYVTHSWSGDISPLDRTDIQSPIFNTVTLGSYQLQYTVVDDEGCIGTDSISIQVIANPVANAGFDNLVLHGESVVIDASSSSCSGGCEFNWQVVSGDTESIDAGQSSAQCTVSPVSATVYRVTVTDGAGCADSDTVVITVGAIPIPAVTYPGIVILLGLIGTMLYAIRRRAITSARTIGLMILCLGGFTASTSAQTYRFVNPYSTSPAIPYTNWQTGAHSIQTVIDFCNSGDTVYVANGNYAENIILDKDITLVSWCLDPESCLIQAPNASIPAVTISDPDINNHQIVLAGFRINGGSKAVFLQNNYSSVQIPLIRNCIIDGYAGYGIHCYNGVFLVEFCTIANNSIGVFASETNSRSSAFFNIISGNTTHGLQIDASYFQMRDNCYFDNGSHIFGAPNAYCDEWSLLTLPDGVDPRFIPGTFRLESDSPCQDFYQGSPYTGCNENRFDQNESPFDLGAYGGTGSQPLPPVIDPAYTDPEPGDFKIAGNAPISCRILDQGTAGLDLSTLVMTVENHGHGQETYNQGDLTISPIPQYGIPPHDCLASGHDLTLPGSSHELFADFAYVRVRVTISDRCPQPNSYSYHWEFHADDLNPPILLAGFYPGQGSVNVPAYGPIEMDLFDAGVGYDPESIFLTLNGDPLSLNLSEVTWTGDHLTIIPRPRFVPGQVNTLTFTIADFYGNAMPTQTITFTCGADVDVPFVPGVTGPAASPGLPSIAPAPVPAPNSAVADIGDPIIFYFQDFSTIVDLMNMEVSIHSGSQTFRYYFESHGGTSRVFQVSGDPQARRITCNPIGGWAISSPITVTITGGRDSASTPNIMLPAVYSFICSSAPIPTLSGWGLILLLIGFGAIIAYRKR